MLVLDSNEFYSWIWMLRMVTNVKVGLKQDVIFMDIPWLDLIVDPIWIRMLRMDTNVWLLITINIYSRGPGGGVARSLLSQIAIVGRWGDRANWPLLNRGEGTQPPLWAETPWKLKPKLFQGGLSPHSPPPWNRLWA